MKVRRRERANNKDRLLGSAKHRDEVATAAPSATHPKGEDPSALVSLPRSSDKSSLSQSQNVISSQSVASPSSETQNISVQPVVLLSSEATNISTQSVVSGSSDPPTITNGHPPRSGETMAEIQPHVTVSAQSVSPDQNSLCVPVQDVHFAGADRQTSPVQLTELVTSKTCCPPSDKNHNLTSMYVVSPSAPLQFPQSNSYVGEGKEGLACYSDPSVAGSAGFVTSYYYQDLSEGKKGDAQGMGQYSVSPESYLPQKDSLYPAHYPFAGDVCKTYNFSTPDTGREYSSPEMTTYSSTAYTSPLTNSLPSAGSPDSVTHWSAADGGKVNPAGDVCTGTVGVTQTGTVSPEAMPEGEKCVSGSQSSGHSTYYSDDQSLEEDSMREIEQDILQSDIHRHIYENYTQHLTIFPPDEESMDQVDDLSPTHPGKTGGGSKKRRRRTQTPVQRKAANMRERKRMVHLNMAFNHLKDRLPNVRNRKKLSRIQTLKAAIFYISLLSECLQSS